MGIRQEFALGLSFDEEVDAGSPELERIFAADGDLAALFDGYQLREGQLEFARASQHAFRSGRVLFAEAPCGCHAKGQPILLFDGSIKAVEDVVVGDALMGPDNKPRHVTALARGRQEMVDVRPIKGAPWRVNLDHILTLQRYGNRKPGARRDCKTGAIVDVSVRDWLTWSHSQKMLHKLFRVGVDFPQQGDAGHPIDAYTLGVLLGDAHLGCASTSVTICISDPEIRTALTDTLEHDFDMCLRESSVRDGTTSYRLVPQTRGAPNRLRAVLRELGLFDARSGAKFVPPAYLRGSRATRHAVLAGLLDTDGYLTSANTYDYVTKSPQLSDDVCFLARSLGLAAYATDKHVPGYGVYRRIFISGDTAEIPCRVKHKQAAPRTQIKSVLRTGFRIARTHTEEDYYGFSLTDDGRFLLGDFTVTHNTGKSFGVLGPLALELARDNGTRAPDADDRPLGLYVTANIALQEQLIEKDLPFVQKLLRERHGKTFDFALLKGFNNYVCRAEAELNQHFSSSDPKLIEMAHSLQDWIQETRTGDKSELDFVPPPELWSRYSTSSTECIKSSCPFFKDCFPMKARWKSLLDSDIVVTNYHFLLSDVKMSQRVGASFFKRRTYLILDEFHEAPTIARDVLGDQLYMGRLFGTMKHVHGATPLTDQGRELIYNKIRALFLALTDHAKSEDYKIRLREPETFPEVAELYTIFGMCRKKVERLATRLSERNDQRSQKALGRCVRAISMLDADMHVLRSIDELPDNHVTSLELPQNSAKPASVRVQRVDVSEDFNQFIFGTWQAVVACSATLVVDHSFSYIERETGAPSNRLDCLEVASPFDFNEQCLLVLPEGLDPDTNTDTFRSGLVRIAVEAVEAADGRALLLFTSYRNMRLVGDALRQINCFGHRLYQQGDLPRTQLVARFREDVHSVLLGVESLWTGVDVQGEALSLLLIDKLPFPTFDDPIMDAFKEKNPRDWFQRFSIPRSVIRIKQAFGRLIRTVDDRGVVVIADPRIQTKGYGKKFLASLPRCERGNTTHDIEPFLSGDGLGDLPF
jgi:ATP-dependent DNA helicase DinG